MLKLVTLTGADQSVRPEELQKISERFPFVEWGILYSQSKAGIPRYPSHDWIDEFIGGRWQKLNMSLHLCGKWARDALAGGIDCTTAPFDYFYRIQINMGATDVKAAYHSDLMAMFRDRPNAKGHQFIVGGKHAGQEPYQFYEGEYDFCPVHILCPVVPLFDASGGRGIAAAGWPDPPKAANGNLIFCGYAGGLGPDNVVQELEKIQASNPGPYWIDMESSLRTKTATGDVFDLDKCVDVLEKAAQFLDK